MDTILKTKWQLALFLCGITWLLTVQTGVAEGNITKPLKVVAVLEPPFVMKDPQTGKYSGFMLDVLEGIGVKISNLDIIGEGPYGMEEDPGVWSGVTGELAEGDSDLAIAAFSIRSKNSKVVTFTQPVIHAGYMVLYKTPKEWSPTRRAMMTMVQPFTPGLWFLIILMCLLTSGCLFLIRRFSPYEQIMPAPRMADGSNAKTWAGGLFYLFSSLMGQGHQSVSTSLSGRALASVWWLFALMTMGAYIAGLVVILFRMDPHVHTLPFGSVEEMVKQTEVGILGVKNSDTYNYISQHSGFLERKVYNMWKSNWDKLMVDSVETALELMMKNDGKYAVFMEEATADYLANQEPCDKMVVGEPIGDQAFGFACKKGSPICDDMNHKILHLQETGQMEKLREKWFWSGCHRGNEYFYEGLPYIDTFGGNSPSIISPLTISVTRFSAAFIVLAVGVGVALLFLIAEIIYGRRKGNVGLLQRRAVHSDDLQRINEDEYVPNRDM